jgi:hypothetical protein
LHDNLTRVESALKMQPVCENWRLQFGQKRQRHVKYDTRSIGRPIKASRSFQENEAALNHSLNKSSI